MLRNPSVITKDRHDLGLHRAAGDVDLARGVEALTETPGLKVYGGPPDAL